MTWEQKISAIQAISSVDGCALRMRKPGDWYCSLPRIEIARDGFLRSSCGNGVTPQEAVEDAWDHLVGERVVINAMSPERREVRWNGFMWEDWK